MSSHLSVVTQHAPPLVVLEGALCQMLLTWTSEVMSASAGNA